MSSQSCNKFSCTITILISDLFVYLYSKDHTAKKNIIALCYLFAVRKIDLTVILPDTTSINVKVNVKDLKISRLIGHFKTFAGLITA